MHSRPTPGIPTAALGHVKNALKHSTIAREDPGWPMIAHGLEEKFYLICQQKISERVKLQT